MKTTGFHSDVRIVGACLYLLPVETRVPLKFGSETLTSVTCARASVTVENKAGRRAAGWGETPISVQWGWPSDISYPERHARLIAFCKDLTRAWAELDVTGHPLIIGQTFISNRLPGLILEEAMGNLESKTCPEPVEGIQIPESTIPFLAALICCSPFDLALHDAYGVLHDITVYETYQPPFLTSDLTNFLKNGIVDLKGRFPSEFLTPRRESLKAWHLVGGLDALDESDLVGDEPDDGFPVTLGDWIKRDGLDCLKIKLRGTDAQWDYARICRVGEIAGEHEVNWLSVDFNCTVTDPAYVTECLDRLRKDEPETFRRILYVEQPFPYDLERYDIDVRKVAARKPLFMDESAHDWQHIKLGLERGWNGVALKTCKTQTGAILSLCWAKAHGMDLMVQDLTNPMLAQIPHVLLAAHAGTIMGVETNAMQFYPEASQPESAVHPGLYTRSNGSIDLSSVRGPGFGYRLNEIERILPQPVAIFGEG